MSALITPEEILDKAWEIWGGDALRVWYEDTLAERERKHNTRRIGNGQSIEVGKTYDLTISKSRRLHLASGAWEYVPGTQTLHGWQFRGLANWSDHYLHFRKPPANDPGYGGVTRDIGPSSILEAVEVTA